jgi:hypothetical protein
MERFIGVLALLVLIGSIPCRPWQLSCAPRVLRECLSSR